MEDNIQKTGPPVEEDKHIIHSLGLQDIKGKPGFCLGDILVYHSSVDVSDVEIILPAELPLYRMVIDEELSEEDAITGIQNLIRLAPNASCIILAHTISAITRQMFIKIGITPQTTPQVIGDSSIFKSSYVSFLSTIYNRDRPIKPIIRLSATPASIELMLNQSVDMVVCADDLHPSEHEYGKKSKEKLESIIRSVGDSTGKTIIKNGEPVELSPNCNTITTGETPYYGSKSTGYRTLIINFIEPINQTVFSELQKTPLTVSTFYYNFISYWIENYDKIFSIIQKRFDEFNKSSLVGITVPRLQRLYFNLECSFFLFLTYLYDIGYDSKENLTYHHGQMQKLLIRTIKEHLDCINKREAENPNNANYLEIINDLINNGAFSFTKDKEEAKNMSYDGIITGKHILIRGERLVKVIKELVPNATLQMITKNLISKGAIDKGKDKTSKPFNGARFIFIKRSKLR